MGADNFNRFESPCNGECIIDPETGYCQGCWRTDVEIAKWLKYTAEERKDIYRNIEERKTGSKAE